MGRERQKKERHNPDGVFVELDAAALSALAQQARDLGFASPADLARHWVRKTLERRQKTLEKHDVERRRDPAPLDAFLPQFANPWVADEVEASPSDGPLFQRIQKRQNRVSNSVQSLLGLETPAEKDEIQ